jgi:hypothetical protein
VGALRIPEREQEQGNRRKGKQERAGGREREREGRWMASASLYT